jgi:hypothetical protein
MPDIDLEEFSTFSFEDFRTTYLVERNLDGARMPKFGEISQEASRFSLEVAKKLNKWAANISNKVGRYVNKITKRSGNLITMRHVRASDGKSGEAAIIVIDVALTEQIKNAKIEVSVIDSNKIMIRISKNIAKLMGVKQLQKVVPNQERAIGHVIAILERIK